MGSEGERWGGTGEPAPLPTHALQQLEPDASDHLRRRVLLAATGTATVLSLVFWAIGAAKDIDSTERVIVPGLAGLFTVLTYLTWRGRLRGAEIGLLAVGGGVLLERIHFTSNLSHAGLRPVLDSYELLIWFPSLYLFAFLLLGKKQALLFSLSLLTASLFIVREWIVPGTSRIYHADTTEFYIGQLGCIVAVYTFSTLKERFLSAHKLAIDLRNFAETDFLTGVPNRRALTQALEREVTRCQRHGGTLAAVLLDIDHFKRINDSLGHDEGDRVLRRVALVLDRMGRQSDVFGRWGGEEFLLIASNLDLLQAEFAAERMRSVLEASGGESAPGVTASFGVSEYRFGDDVASLVKRADEALMEAKQSGRNRVIGHDA